ncbi:hypothetical protein, partial [Alicyclobacillus sp. SP_1]|uniref:hypothetical protein n=1 Tax=Alicyclobacillus sp. SP_1 TaxID=2942475 RepID=UPI002157EB50
QNPYTFIRQIAREILVTAGFLVHSAAPILNSELPFNPWFANGPVYADRNLCTRTLYLTASPRHKIQAGHKP